MAFLDLQLMACIHEVLLVTVTVTVTQTLSQCSTFWPARSLNRHADEIQYLLWSTHSPATASATASATVAVLHCMPANLALLEAEALAMS
jgi:hypothetical protein